MEAPGEFVFRAAQHDVGSKTVLGLSFPPGGGIEEGESAIRMLAHQPATARHLAYQLCQRLIADEPPSGLVERVAKTFRNTDGDLRETVRAIVESPEFFETKYYRAKVKSPFEYVVSAIRAVGGATDGRAVSRELAAMGEPLYLCQPPTGYSDTAAAWVSSGALLTRMNFALALARGDLRGTASSIPEGDSSVVTIARALLGTELSAETQETIRQRVAHEADSEPRTLIAGLVLGSPEFQRQ